jgi:CTP:molybdopterin cytidylyltransferase MocA
MRPSLTACGVVLGAGSGSRFGGPKQLAELQGRPLVQWSLDAACAATALERGEGMAASLRCGLEAAAGAEWLVVTLADEPRLPAPAIERVVAAARAAPADIRAVRARWSGRPGNPGQLRDIDTPDQLDELNL